MPDTAADFLSRFDAALGCQHCGGPLGESPSDDFCSPAHQRMWHEQHAEPLPWSNDAADVFVGRDGLRVPLNEPGSPRYGFGAETDPATGAIRVGTITADMIVNGGIVTRTRREWRLPRQTGNAAQDAAALLLAEQSAGTEDQRAACRLRRDQIAERRRPHFEMRVSTEGATAALRRMAERLAEFRPRVILGPGDDPWNLEPFQRLYLNSMVSHHATGNEVDVRAPWRGHHVTWSVTDETSRGPCVSVTYDEPYRTADSPDPPTAAERAIQARRNRNTGPPASRMDGRRGRGGPRR